MLLTLITVNYLFGSDVIEPCGGQGVTMPRCYRLYYLNFSSGDLTSTSSHMCGSWYLPIFLFRDGSFTLYQYCLLDGSGNVLVLPAHYAKVVQKHLMTSDVMMVMDR